MRQFGLPKQCLLRKSSDFDTVYRHGTRLQGNGFSILFLPTSRENSRIGISVSRKIKGAVVRNRIKRIFRESFRLHKNDYPQGADIVIVVRPHFNLDSPNLIIRAVRNLVTAESK